MQKPNYRPEIDGLRAIAVLAVVLFHTGLGFSGGYIGVDVFFVISGFLITGLILRAQQEGSFELRDFWLRRIRRLFPAMAVMQIGVLLVGLAIMLPMQLQKLGESSLAQLLLHSNFYFANELDYFAGPAELKPLLHTWSLAVEEQFYLLLPLLLIGLRRFSRSTVVACLWSFTIVSFALNVWGIGNYPTHTFFLLPFRAWELLLGGLLACAAPVAENLRRDNWLGGIGLFGIGVGTLAFDSQTEFPGIAALLPCVSTLLVLHGAKNRNTVIHRILSARVLVGVGLISYSLYLVHWPILAFANLHFGMLSIGHRIGAVVLSLLLGYVSWRFVETPFRSRQILGSPRRLVGAAVACSVLLVTTAVICDKARGLPERWDPAVRSLFADARVDTRFARRSVKDVRNGALPRLGSTGTAPAVLVWGDSHATALGQLCDSLATEVGITGYLASRGGVAPLVATWRSGHEEAADWNDEVLRFVEQKRIRDVILISRWAIHVEKTPEGLTRSLLQDAASTERSCEASRDVLRRGLSRTISKLESLGARVWIMKQVPCQSGDPIRKLVAAARRGDDSPPDGISLSEHRHNQESVTAILNAVASPGTTLVDPTPACFTESGRSRIGTLQQSYYSDDNHVSRHGANELVGPALRPVFERIAADYFVRQVASNPAPAIE